MYQREDNVLKTMKKNIGSQLTPDCRSLLSKKPTFLSKVTVSQLSGTISNFGDRLVKLVIDKYFGDFKSISVME